MKVKAFFKSNAFKSVAVLLIIALFAGALLAIFNDLLYVSPAERRARMFKKLYGGDVTEREALLTSDDQKMVYGNGEVTQAYLMSDGTYAIQSTGKGGYSGGSITVWVILSCTGTKENGDLRLTGVDKVVYESSDKQSYIGRFTDADYLQFTKYDEAVASGKLFGDDIDVLKTGASAPLTFGALKSAVNAALRYMRTEIIGEQEKVNPYEYGDYIDLTQSQATVTETRIEYSLTVKGNSPAGKFLIDITVENGIISAYAIKTNGSTKPSNSSKPSYADLMPEEIKDGSFFLGKNRTQIEDLLSEKGTLSEAGGTLQTGATKSVESCVRAAAFAVCNYEKILTDGGLTNE